MGSWRHDREASHRTDPLARAGSPFPPRQRAGGGRPRIRTRPKSFLGVRWRASATTAGQGSRQVQRRLPPRPGRRRLRPTLQTRQRGHPPPSASSPPRQVCSAAADFPPTRPTAWSVPTLTTRSSPIHHPCVAIACGFPTCRLLMTPTWVHLHAQLQNQPHPASPRDQPRLPPRFPTRSTHPSSFPPTLPPPMTDSPQLAASAVIKQISSEVDELHPLLQELFSHIPDISGVEYTHGPNEMGADFVLTRIDSVLNRLEYIGIIAKVGKIHQDLVSLQRQIDECLHVSRPIEGGKKRIHLSSVWIVTTDTITHGAQRKIEAKYRTFPVQFISGTNLATLLSDHLPHHLAEVPIPIAQYLRSVRHLAAEQDSRHDILQLAGEPFYLPQQLDRLTVDPYSPRKRYRRKRSPVVFLGQLSSQRVLFVEAGMGGGKSKLIRHHLQELAHSSAFTQHPILPVATTYKQLLDDYDGNLDTCLSALVPQPAVHALPDDTRIIFFVDAVDEKDQSQAEFFNTLHDLTRQTSATSRYRLVLTSRPIGNLDFDKEFPHTVARYEIRRLSVGQIIKFLDEICRRVNLTTRIVDDIRRSPLFAQLPRSPLAAALLARILRDDPKDLPSTLPELYAKYVELALGRWDIAKGLQSQQEYDVLRAVLMGLATYMLDNELASVTADEFRARIEDYLGERNLNVTADAVFRNAVNRSRILVRSRDEHLIWFRHRTFAEFLAASRRIQEGTLTPSVKAFELYWSNVYYFGCGKLRDAPELIEGLATLPAIEEHHRLLKPMHMANYVMAAYATPYEVIERAVATSIRDAAGLFFDIITGNCDSRFASLSRMDLLCLMQLLVRDHYGYEFLRGALERAALEALEQPEDEVTPYFMFLLAVASIDAGSSDGFTTLLNKYRNRGHLPIDVSLGIMHEDEGSTRRKLLRKLRRRVRKGERDNQKAAAERASLYNTPIRLLVSSTRSKADEPGSATEGTRR